MNELRAQLFEILVDICGTDEILSNPDVELYDQGLLDSFGTVQLLVEIEEKVGVSIPISEFDRDQWSTPNKMVVRVEELQR